MIARLFLLLSIINAHSYAMESKACWFNKMPTKVTGLIASFLPFDNIESDQEFIERTQTILVKKTPDEYLKHLPELKKDQNSILTTTRSAYCPSNKTIAIVYNSIYALFPLLIIVDKKTNQKLYAERIAALSCPLIAISRNKDMYAFVHPEKNDFTNEIKTILSVENIISKKTESYGIPTHYEPIPGHSSISFNKQGTKLILYARDMQISKKVYIIHPLTVNTPNPDIDNKKTLTKYFAQRGVCKELNKQILSIQ